VACYALIAHSETIRSDSSTTVQGAIPSLSLHACLWLGGTDDSTEFHYVVDLDKKKIISKMIHRIPSGQSPECAQVRVDRKKNAAAAYTQIIQQTKNREGRTDLDADLLETLQEIEERAKVGGPPEGWLTTNPAGTHTIIAVRGMPILVVEIATLDTHILARGHLTPVAWSPDSRFIAFAPLLMDKLYIYDAGKHGIVSTKTIAGRSVQALSWSPDMQHIAAFEFHNSRLSKTPLSLFGAMVGHPNYLNDGVLSVYRVSDEQNFSVILKKGISEMNDSPDIELEWK